MTRTAPGAISLENHKRKGPVRGPYASKLQGRKNAYGPSRNAYGATRNGYGKIDASLSQPILLLPKFVFSKTSHEGEHSENEFYYPGELSHAELLHQSPTHSKSKERNLTLLANEEAHNFLRSQ